MVNVNLKLPKKMGEKVDNLMDAVSQLIQLQLGTRTQSTYIPRASLFAASPSPFEQPSEEEKQVVEAWMKEIDPVIEKEAVAMLKGQVRGLMLMGGNVKAVAKALKEKKKPKLVRKKEGRKDPLYIQIGDGVEEPIEEIYLFG